MSASAVETLIEFSRMTPSAGVFGDPVQNMRLRGESNRNGKHTDVRSEIGHERVLAAVRWKVQARPQDQNGT